MKGWEEQKWTKPVLSEHIELESVEMVMEMFKEKNIESEPTGKESARSRQGAWHGLLYLGVYRRLLQWTRVAGSNCQTSGILRPI